jgi:hypothetical protein
MLIPNVLTIWERCAIVTIKVHPDILTKELQETEQNIIQDMWPWKRLKPDKRNVATIIPYYNHNLVASKLIPKLSKLYFF